MALVHDANGGETRGASSKETSSGSISDALQELANARGRPLAVLISNQSLGRGHVLAMRDQLKDRRFDDLDVVIHSGGGSIHAAYLLMELFRLRAQRVHACVPLYAKSAATLLCIGSDSITLDEIAELGPLDTQIPEEEKEGHFHYTSALNPFKTLEQLQKFSLETLDSAVQLMLQSSGMDLNNCVQHGINFVSATIGPMFGKLDPIQLGKYSRALSLGTEYGRRLLARSTQWPEEKVDQVLEQLVHRYPSHDYIIDHQELTTMGFSARLFANGEAKVVRNLQKGLIAGSTELISLMDPVTIAAAGDRPKERRTATLAKTQKGES